MYCMKKVEDQPGYKNSDGKRRRFPYIGLRIIKSAIAIELCYLVSFLRGDKGIVFYSQLATLWCIQMYVSNTKKNALQRLTGTVIGAVYGLVFLLVKNPAKEVGLSGKAVNSLAVSGMIVLVLYTTVIIKKKQASYFSCVVFLSIVVNHVSDANPYLFVWNRFLDTVIGIVIGIGVNTFSLPREKKKDVLFISGVDDVLLNNTEVLSDYSKVELNRMLDEGMNFTLSTMRTPASLVETMGDIRLKLPVIAMDGAVLYDIREKMYLKVYVISPGQSEQILSLVKAHGLMSFTNVIVDDLLIIHYEETGDEVHKKLVAKLRRSPYRNYVKRPPSKESEVVYFMLLYPSSVIEKFYAVLEAEGYTSSLKILKYDSRDYPGYSYIKIYNRNATKENMTCYLKQRLDIQKTMTFGSIPGRYDEYIEGGNMNRAIHILKRRYEPVKRPKLLAK